jgi:hypothetical protein
MWMGMRGSFVLVEKWWCWSTEILSQGGSMERSGRRRKKWEQVVGK